MVSKAMDVVYMETEFVKLVRHHFTFLRDMGYAEPILGREESALYTSWIVMVYSSASLKLSCRISLFLLQNEGRVALSLTRDPHRMSSDYLDFQVYMEKRIGTPIPWIFRVAGGTGSELGGPFEEVIRLNAQALREHGRGLVDGSAWEAGYYHRKD